MKDTARVSRGVDSASGAFFVWEGEMTIGRWEEPITFETMKLGQYRTITSAAEAAHVLMGQWPVETGRALMRAQETCLAVLEGKEEPAAARKAFVKSGEGGRGVYPDVTALCRRNVFTRRRGPDMHDQTDEAT